MNYLQNSNKQIKQNRQLLTSKRDKKLKDNLNKVYKKANTKKIKSKNISEEELIKIKEKIRKESKDQKKKEMLIFLFFFFIVLCSIIYFSL